jgi:hypothetical protein
MERVRGTRASKERTGLARPARAPDPNWPRLVRDPLAIFACVTLAACSLGSSDHDANLRKNAPSDPANGATSTPSENAPGTHDPQPLADPMTLVPAYTEYLGRLTGTNQSPLPSGMDGTDLGASFVRDGKLTFVFGDTLSQVNALKDVDTFAFADPVFPKSGIPSLAWGTTGTSPTPLRLPGVALGTYEVPVDGFALGDTTYLFFATKFDIATNRYGSSTLAKANKLSLDSLEVVHEVASLHFVNVSVLVEGNDAFVYGAGKEYRESAIYLAKVPLAQIGDRSAWRYRDATGAWVANEAAAAPVLPNAPSCVGELSVKKDPSHPLWVMTYGCGAEPRGVQLHVAASPEGPWSKAMRVFGPDDGYEKVMHAKESVVGHDDGLAPPGNEDDWGGEYGPYLVPSWFVQEGDAIGITYTLSSWVPYQVHLVRTWLVPQGMTKTKPNPGVGKPKTTLVNPSFATGDFTGWQVTGDSFVVFPHNGTNAVTSYTPAKGDATVGRLSQSFVVDATTSELDFKIHGGDGRVTLWRGNELLRSSRARRNNDVETEVHWNISNHRGETLRVVIEDDLTSTWGFVGARDFTLK